MINEISIDCTEEWDRIVTSFHEYDIYYLSGYVKAFKIHGDGEPTLIYYEDIDLRAINVFLLRDIGDNKKFENKIPIDTYFDITTPYGYGGLLIEGNITDNSLKLLEQEYTTYCMNKGIISEFVRFHPILNNSQGLGGIYDISKLGKTIGINLTSKEEIWNNLTSKNRNMVRKALKSGVEVFWGRSKELFESFMPLYKATMDKDKAKKYYYFNESFFDSILYDCKYNVLVFYAVYQKIIISMSILLLANGYMNYHLSSSIKEYQYLAPTNLLLFEAACWGCDNGFKTLHLGGGLGSNEDSLYKFKSSFSKDSDYSFMIGTKIFDKRKYDELVEIGKVKERDNFFPTYRGGYL